jgi:hypothetical protein
MTKRAQIITAIVLAVLAVILVFSSMFFVVRKTTLEIANKDITAFETRGITPEFNGTLPTLPANPSPDEEAKYEEEKAKYDAELKTYTTNFKNYVDEKSQIQKAISIFAYDRYEATRRVEVAVPKARVTIEAKFPSRVEIKLEERKPAYFYQSQTGGYIVLDRDLKYIQNVTDKQNIPDAAKVREIDFDLPPSILIGTSMNNEPLRQLTQMFAALDFENQITNASSQALFAMTIINEEVTQTNGDVKKIQRVEIETNGKDKANNTIKVVFENINLNAKLAAQNLVDVYNFVINPNNDITVADKTITVDENGMPRNNSGETFNI